MKYLSKISFAAILVFGILVVGLQAKSGNKDNPDTPVEYSSNYENYGSKKVTMSLKNFKSSQNTLSTFLGDCDPGGLANLCCPYWNVTVVWTWTGPTVTCETGGQFKCRENCGEVGNNGDGDLQREEAN